MSHADALSRSPCRRRHRERKPKAEPEETRVDFSKQQLRAHRHRLPSGITSHCVDGSYAKKKYIDEVVRLDLHAITKLRSDANCVLLSTGPHPKRRGAKRKYAGKVNFQAVSRFEDLGTREDEPRLPLYTAVVWHKTLQRRLRLVVLLNRKDPAKPRFIVLGSTDPELHGHKLLDVHFISSSPVELQPAYRVEGDIRHVQSVEGED